MKSREPMGKKEPSRGTSAKTAGIGMATDPIPRGRESHTPKGAAMSEEMRYRAEADMGTLHRAQQIITDKPRHAAVKQHAAEVFAAATSPGISTSGNARGNTDRFPAAKGPGETVNRKGKR